MLNDWRKAVHRTPISFTITNDTLRIQTQFVTVVSIAGIVVLFVLYTLVPHSRVTLNNIHQNLDEDHGHGHGNGHHQELRCSKPKPYNSTYPLTIVEHLGDNRVRYRIAVITDLDTNSKISNEDNVWKSHLLKGFLTYFPNDEVIHVKWEKRSMVIRSSIALSGRGMELSELIVFNGKLYSCDDRTGIIYEIRDNVAIPWVILTDGDGYSTKGFKCEWMTVKDAVLHIGGLGKEWTSNTGQLINYNPQWIKAVTVSGEIEHRNWRDNYLKLRSACGIQYPGYVIHESAVWSNVHQKWFFLPRRASSSAYNDVDDEKKGTNIFLSSNDAFTDVEMNTIGPVIPTHGFSSFKFVPNTNDRVIIALKSEEDNGNVGTYITAFTIDGKILMPEQLIGKFKFEGIEFI